MLAATLPAFSGAAHAQGEDPPTQPSSPFPSRIVDCLPTFIVYFDWDDATISPSTARILDFAAELDRSECRGRRYVVVGHADRSGHAEYNVGLSARRLENVRRYLVARGIPEGIISARAMGEDCPIVRTADGARNDENRRVELTFVFSGTSQEINQALECRVYR